MTGATFTIGLGLLEHCPRRPGATPRAPPRALVLPAADRVPCGANMLARLRGALSGPSRRFAARAVIKAEAAAAAAPGGGGAADTGLAAMALTVRRGRWPHRRPAPPLPCNDFI
jgi:hypothetical protein